MRLVARDGVGIVHLKVRVVHGPQGRGVVGLVLHDIGLINPLKTLHEPIEHVTERSFNQVADYPTDISSIAGLTKRMQAIKKNGN